MLAARPLLLTHDGMMSRGEEEKRNKKDGMLPVLELSGCTSAEFDSA